MFTAVLVALRWSALILVGLAVFIGPIIAAVLWVRERRAQRQRAWPSVVATSAQRRWRATRRWESGDPEATEILPCRDGEDIFG